MGKRKALNLRAVASDEMIGNVIANKNVKIEGLEMAVDEVGSNMRILRDAYITVLKENSKLKAKLKDVEL